MALKKNDIETITITGMTAEGNGVGRICDMAVFVPASAPGDVLSVRIVKVLKNYAFGKIEKIMQPSKDRVEPDCPVFAQCGGCAYRHLSYEAELIVKEQRVRDAVTRIAGLSEELINPIVGAASSGRYRNKAQLPFAVGKGKTLEMGFFAPHSHRVVACGDCLLQPTVFRAAMDAVKKWAQECSPSVYEEEGHKGLLRHLYLRLGEKTNEVMVCLVANGEQVPCENRLVELLCENVPGIKSVVLNVNTERTNVIVGKKCRTLWGKESITDELCSLHFSLSPRSFYQVNRAQAERLYRLAADFAKLTKEDVLLDLYCGTGTIGLSMAHLVKEVIGVEVVKQAVRDAGVNAQNNGITNARFLCADAAQAAAQLNEQGVKPDVVIIDPPRKGCAPGLIGTIAALSPKRVVYVSCDPATLSRDLKLFAQEGYRTLAVTPVDMFPRTAHVEAVALLDRNKA